MANGRNEVTVTVSDLEQMCSGSHKDRTALADYFKQKAGWNGWSNFETWHTYAYITSDQRLNYSWHRHAAEILKESVQKVSGLFLTPYESARNKLINLLKDHFERRTEKHSSLDQNSRAFITRSLF